MTRRGLAATLLVAAALFAGPARLDAVASHPTCAATILYIVRGDSSPARVEAYCGTANTPVSQFALQRPERVIGLDHDNRGNIIVLQTTEAEGPTAGVLTAYAPDGHVLATVDGLENANGLAIDRMRRKAYVYSPHRSDEPMQGTTTLYARWSGRFAVFDTDALRRTGYVQTDQTENAFDFFVDRKAMLWIYDNTDRGLVSLQKRLPFNTCAIAPGPDGTLFAISCEGVLRAIDASSGATIDTRDLGTGAVFGGLEARLAVDSIGNAYLYNASTNRLSCYKRGASQASSTVPASVIYKLLISPVDNDLYVLHGYTSIDVYHGCGLQLVHTYPFPSAVMTLVPPSAQAP